jgi:hypothetical protein
LLNRDYETVQRVWLRKIICPVYIGSKEGHEDVWILPILDAIITVMRLFDFKRIIGLVRGLQMRICYFMLSLSFFHPIARVSQPTATSGCARLVMQIVQWNGRSFARSLRK